MNFELFRRALAAVRRSALIWGAALLALTLTVMAVWPALQETDGLSAITEGFSPDLLAALGMEDIASAAGYMNGQLYALLLPLLVSALVVMQTNTLTAGDEDAGRLELLLALPVSRTSVYLTRFAAVLVTLAVLAAVIGATVYFGAEPFDMELSGEGVVAATAMVALLALAHGALAMALAGLGMRGPGVLGITFGVLVVGYFVNALFPLVEALEDLVVISPWDWALGGNPLAEGFDGTGVALLAGTTALLVLVGLAGIRRRTIRTA